VHAAITFGSLRLRYCLLSDAKGVDTDADTHSDEPYAKHLLVHMIHHPRRQIGDVAVIQRQVRKSNPEAMPSVTTAVFPVNLPI